MLKKLSPKLPGYNPVDEGRLATRGPNNIPEIEAKLFKIPKKRAKRPLPPDLEEKRAKLLKEEDDKESEEVEAILRQGDPKVIVPLLTGDDACVQSLVTEGECNPRAWSMQDVRDFLVKHELEQPALKLEAIKVNGDMLLRLNRETLALRMEAKNAMKVFRLVTMLRRIECGYLEKRKPCTVLTPELPAIPPIPKRRLDDPHRLEIQAKRMRYAQNPEAFEREVEKEVLDKDRYPSIPEGYRRGGGKKICYKCKEEGHLGRECTKPNIDRSFRNPAAASSSVDDWDKSFTNPAAPSGDDDWDMPATATPTPLEKSSAPPQTDDWGSGIEAPVKAEGKTKDDDWGSTSIAASTPTVKPAGDDDDWGSATTPSNPPSTSWNSGGNNRGRGGFNGGRGGGRGGGSTGPRVCFRCNQEGHMSRECTQGGGGGGKKICYKCKEEGHLGRECTKSSNGFSDRSFSNPPAAAPNDNDWDLPGTATPTSSAPPPTDDWGSSIETPVKPEAKIKDNDWGSTSISVSTPTVKPAGDDDDWGSATTPSNPPSTHWNRGGNNRGRGGFNGGRGGGRGGGSGGPRVCFRCNQEGHMSRECTQGGGGGGKKICYKCKEEGHLGRECTKSSNGFSDRSFTNPPAAAPNENDWDLPATATPTSSAPPQTDDWGTSFEAPVKAEAKINDDDWGSTSISVSTPTVKPAGEDDDWGSATTPSNPPSTPWNSGGNNRGRGGFNGGRGGGRGGGSGGPRVCFRCNQEGHMSRECTQGGGGGGKKICYKCKEEGHLGQECTKPNNGFSDRSFTNPPAAAPNDNDWDLPATATPTSSAPPPTDDWGSSIETPVKAEAKTKDDDWGSTSISVSTPTVKPAGDDDDWGSATTPSNPPSTPWNSGGNNRGRGGFNGGRGGGRGGGSGGPRVCFRCNQEGHMSRECTQGGGGGGKKICYKCKEEGHLGRECTKPNNGFSDRSFTNPPAAAPNDNDWDLPATATPTSSAPPPTDDWGSSIETPVKAEAKIKDDDWGSTSISVSTPTVKPAGEDDDWGSATTPSNPPSTHWNSGGNNRGRGGFNGGRGGGRGGGSGGPRVCFRCNQEGHMSRECTQGGGGGGKKICYKCKEEGHLGRECTKSSNGFSDRSFTNPPAAAPNENDWDLPATATPTSSAPPQTDDWGTSIEAPVKAEAKIGEDDWGSTSISVSTPTVKTAGDDDDWGSATTASNPPSTHWNSGGNNRGRGGFNGGRGGGRGGGSGGPRVCFRCNQEGHMSRECTQGGGGGGKKICYKCKEEGHLGRECTKPSNGFSDRSFTNPPAAASSVDDWNQSPTATPTPSAPPPTDDWGTGTEVPVKPETKMVDDWGNNSVSVLTPKPADGDDWGSGSTPSNPPSTHSGDNDRRRGGFNGGRGGSGGPIVCYRCNQEGHISRDCSQRGGKKICYKCEQEGHLGRECPNSANSGRSDSRSRRRRFVEVDDRGTFSVEMGSNPFQMAVSDCDEDFWAGEPLTNSRTRSESTRSTMDDEVEDGQLLESSP